jgi:hypothetical protein
MQRQPELDRSRGTIHDDGRRDGLHAGGPHRLERLHQRGTGGQDVVHHHDPLGWSDRPAATQGATTAVHRFRERGPCGPTQLARRLEGEEDAAGRRPHDQRRSIRCKGGGEAAADLHADARMLQDEELLEVAAGVTAGLEGEVAVEQGTGIGEQGLDGGVAKGRIGHYS